MGIPRHTCPSPSSPYLTYTAATTTTATPASSIDPSGFIMYPSGELCKGDDVNIASGCSYYIDTPLDLAEGENCSLISIIPDNQGCTKGAIISHRCCESNSTINLLISEAVGLCFDHSVTPLLKSGSVTANRLSNCSYNPLP